MFSKQEQTVTPTQGTGSRAHSAQDTIAATGMQDAELDAELIAPAARSPEQAFEQPVPLSVLPAEAFEAFRTAVEGPGRVVSGLAHAAQASRGLLKQTE
ncbi:MAG: hypothetical protein GDA36_10940 [Rhodobacteraceae bacterium]|nr:hypothetical protein [Paracoccaceae bacterium]